MNLYILCLLLSVARSVKYFRLTTNVKVGSESMLTPSDLLVSTLGNFRVRLVGQTCQLRIQEFSGGDYKVRGFFPEDIFKLSCSYIVVKQGALVTEAEAIILKIKASQLKILSATTFSIDDLGTLRLTGLTTTTSQNPQQAFISTYRSPNKYVYPTSNSIVTSSSTMLFLINQGGWGFSARNGEFRIFNTDDPSQIVRYRYSAFTISPGKIQDRMAHEPPISNIDGMNYEEKCGYVQYLNFKYPLLFVADRYWPELRVLDQGGYQILAIRYPDYNCILDLGINAVEGRKQCIGWFCPDGTFEFEGQCVLVCPSPYYHQIKTNFKNRCVLNCEQGSTINEQSRVCTCGAEFQALQCPSGTKAYPLGCYCPQMGTYFNGVGCSNQCSLGFVRLSLSASNNVNGVMRAGQNFGQFNAQLGGVCIQCPYKCLRCSQESKKIASTFLICRQCTKGYTLLNNICKKECQKSPQLPNQQSLFSSLTPAQLASLQINCQSPCTIQFCQKCTKSTNNNIANLVSASDTGKQICIQCARPLILFRNACIKKCPERYIIRNTDTFHFYCQQVKNCQEFGLDLPRVSRPKQYSRCVECNNYQGVCWIDCSKGSYFHNQSSCYCLLNKNADQIYEYGYYSQCQSQSLPPSPNSSINSSTSTPSPKPCPVSQYLYQPTQQCLACPFGCLTCIHDSYGFVECTSCSSSYFLMVDLNETHYCQRDTSLTQCQLYAGTPIQKVYDGRFRICDYVSYSTTNGMYLIKRERVMCRDREPNCLTCLYQSSKTCTYCATGYFLYNGKCLPKCPQSTLQYQKICLQNSLPQCQSTAITQHFLLTNISQSSIYLQGYDYFLPSAFYTYNKVIDPIGNIFLYAYLYNRDMGSRVAEFPYPVQQCIQCMDGHALDFYTGVCEKCQQPACQKCANSNERVCLRCWDDYKLDDGGACAEKSQQEKDCKLGEWKNQGMVCVRGCQGFWVRGRAYGVVNCSRYCHDNQEAGRYFRIEEDRERTGNHLLCIQQETPSKQQTLTLASSIHNLSPTLSLLILAPIEQKLSSPLNASLMTVSTRANTLGSRNRLISSKDLLYADVEVDRLWVLVRRDGDVAVGVVVAVDVSRLYGLSERRMRVEGRYLKQEGEREMVGQQKNQKIYLPQSQYLFPPSSPPYSTQLTHSLQIPCILLTLLSLSLTFLFLSQQLLYKTDNLIIFLQTLPLTLYSLDIRLLDPTFYQFLFNFRLAVAGVGGQAGGRLGFGVMGWVVGEDGVYVEDVEMNMMVLLAVDGNIVRHCTDFIVILIAILILGWLIGTCCLRDQIAIFWKQRRSDRELQLPQPTPKQSNNPNQSYQPISPSPATHENLLESNQNHRGVFEKEFKEEEMYREEKKEGRVKKGHGHGHGKGRKTASQRMKKAMAKTAPTMGPHTKITSHYNEIEPIPPTPLHLRLKSLLHSLLHPGSQFHKYSQTDLNHFPQLKQTLTFLLQSSTIILVYYSLVTLRARPISVQGFEDGIGRGRTVAVVCCGVVLAAVGAYAVGRGRVNRVGGMYMMKRIVLGVVLALVEGVSIKVGFCAIVQLIFMAARIAIEQLPFISSLNPNPQPHPQQQPPAQPNPKPQTTAPPLKKPKKQSLPSSKQKQDLSQPCAQENQNLSLPYKGSQSHPVIEELSDQQAGSSGNRGKGRVKGGERELKNADLVGKLKEKKKKREELMLANKTNTQSKGCGHCFKSLRHNLKPYSRLLTLITQQILLAACYILLSQTDNFSTLPTPTHSQGYHPTLILTIIFITLVICHYLVGFGYELVCLLVDSWVQRGLTEGEKRSREGVRKLGEIRGYWRDVEELEGLAGQRGKERQVLAQHSYMEYLNQFTHRQHNPQHPVPPNQQLHKMPPALYQHIY